MYRPMIIGLSAAEQDNASGSGASEQAKNPAHHRAADSAILIRIGHGWGYTAINFIDERDTVPAISFELFLWKGELNNHVTDHRSFVATQ